MIRSFIREARWLDGFLKNMQLDGWKIISITPIEEKKWSDSAKMYVDKNQFVIIAEEPYSERYKSME